MGHRGSGIVRPKLCLLAASLRVQNVIPLPPSKQRGLNFPRKRSFVQSLFTLAVTSFNGLLISEICGHNADLPHAHPIAPSHFTLREDGSIQAHPQMTQMTQMGKKKSALGSIGRIHRRAREDPV
jgi:hypothetical protein